MDVIIITLPEMFATETEARAEARAICEMALSGAVTLVHVRKPSATDSEVAALLARLPAEVRRRVVVHDHFALASPYGLCGIHLTGRNPSPPEGWEGYVSASCHSLGEAVVRLAGGCRRVTLSPVFDSVSKPGYRSAFTPAELEEARRGGRLGARVAALGGVTVARLPLVAACGFGGAALLGEPWQAWKEGRLKPYLAELSLSCARIADKCEKISNFTPDFRNIAKTRYD